MAFVYKRGNVWWYRVKDDGRWVSKRTEFKVSDEYGQRNATRLASRSQERIDTRQAGGEHDTSPITVRRYVSKWLDDRKKSEHDWKADKGRLTNHVIPVLGDLVIAKVRTRDIAALVRKLRFPSNPAMKLAPRTVRNIYSVVAAMFRDAAVTGDIEIDPRILTEDQLGPIVDRDREWRAGAYYTREEAEILISHQDIPVDRQLVYAFGLLAGLRPGEAGALRWRHYDPTMEPLGSLLVATSYNVKRQATKGTKTETTKSIPVHPTLATMLAEWRQIGWAAMMGREPEPDDLIVPLPPETVARWTVRSGDPYRGYDYSGRRWREIDLPMLGWRERSMYDARSTFITLAIEDGAKPETIRDRVTHTKPKRSAFDGYDRGPHWVETCREVAKLRVSRRARVTTRVTVDGSPSRKRAPKEGIEPRTRRSQTSTIMRSSNDHHDLRVDYLPVHPLPSSLFSRLVAAAWQQDRRLKRHQQGP